MRRLGRLVVLAWMLVLSAGIALSLTLMMGGSPWIGAYASWLLPLYALSRVGPRSFRDSTACRLFLDPLLAGPFGASMALAIGGAPAQAAALAVGAYLAAYALDCVAARSSPPPRTRRNRGHAATAARSSFAPLTPPRPSVRLATSASPKQEQELPPPVHEVKQ